ncbi:hypothetical protein AVO45_12560 [Ruegeria marisrubri]|uniref:DUF4935 domain-containing protein n=1 Tax=Ruegeria marisrubri TaxID=1685379 RepID=A0A0X3TK59_9RHOB|nr:hypothetical protein AVO45_12560 [Ruegeria marisrubri]
MFLFIDTNVYLDFFRLKQDSLEELRKLVELIKAGKISLLSTNQLKDEYLRNRDSVISQTLSKMGQKREYPFPPAV